MLVYLWLIIYGTNGLSMNLAGYFVKRRGVIWVELIGLSTSY